MSIFEWSAVANNNQTADPDINWREGQAPSTVNNSARAMMAAIAAWHEDLSGNTVVTGSPNAIIVALTIAPAPGSYTKPFLFSFRPLSTNTGPVTIAITSTGGSTIGPCALRAKSGTDLQAGELDQNTLYICAWTDRNSEFILLNDSVTKADNLILINNAQSAAQSYAQIAAANAQDAAQSYALNAANSAQPPRRATLKVPRTTLKRSPKTLRIQPRPTRRATPTP